MGVYDTVIIKVVIAIVHRSHLEFIISFVQAALPSPAHSREQSSVVMADACALPALCDGAPCTWGAATRWTCAVGRPVVLPPWARWPRGSLGRCFFLPSPKRRCVRGAVASYVRYRAEVVPEADIVNAEFVALLSDEDATFWDEFDVLDA